MVTNAHVVGGFSEVTVIFGGRCEFTGEVVGIDEVVDLAVIKIESRGQLPVLSFGYSDAGAVGDDVIAIGYPLGSVLGTAPTVTKGILSSERHSGDVDYFQTDAAINPGNSGGPLVNVRGEVIGINTGRVDSILGRPVQGIGLAITAKVVQELLGFLIAGGEVRAPTYVVASAPTPSTDAVSSVYTSDKYWYTIEVPAGWRIDSGDSDLVSIWDPNAFSVVWVRTRPIDPGTYPTLDSYLLDWEPAPAEGWTDFQIRDSRRRRSKYPVEAQEFLYTYFNQAGTPTKGSSQWYLVGRHLIQVTALADEENIWKKPSDVRTKFLAIQDSFEPVSYTSDEYGYSLAHPVDWVEYKPQADYTAYYPDSQSTKVYVSIDSAAGYFTALDYGANHTVIDADVISRAEVYTGRPNPSYRIEYIFASAGTGPIRGAVLITLGGGNAIWVWVQGNNDEWTELEPLVDDIFLRVAVKP